MSQTFLLTALIPLALLAVLGVVLGGGRLSPTMQDWIERALFVVYPVFVLWWLWLVIVNVRHGDMIFALMFGVAAVGAMHEALKMFRRRRLRARSAG